MELNVLIDRATAIAGTRYKLAQALGVPPTMIYQWQKGKPCPAADVALMAQIAGLDPVEWLVRATLEKYQGTEKGEQLQRALGKLSPATGGGTGFAGEKPEPIYSSPDIPRCILMLSFQLQNAERLKALFLCPSVATAVRQRGRKHPPTWRGRTCKPHAHRVRHRSRREHQPG